MRAHRVMLVGLCAVVGGLVWSGSATAGGVSGLIDGRGWEMVTPPDKLGSSVSPPGEEGGLVQASEAGRALTYVSAAPVVKEGVLGNRSFERVQNLAVESGGVWASRDIETPNSMLGKHFLGRTDTEYKKFTDELSAAVVMPPGEGFLSALQGDNQERTVFTRDLVSGVFTPLVTEANTRNGVRFGQGFPNAVEFRGASPDLSHVVVSSEQPLTSEVAAAGKEDLYEASGGGLQLVSILPNGHPVSEPGEGETPRSGQLGDEGARIERNAISSEGSRIVWEASTGEPHHLYLRSVTNHETVQLDVLQSGGSESEPSPTFQGANADDSRIYFEDGERLTSDSHAAPGSPPDLYVAEVHGSPMEVTVTDLTKDTNSEQKAAVRGNMLGYGEDAAGATIYYVADGALSSAATAGECAAFSGSCTLYVQRYSNATREWGSPEKIAQLAGGADKSTWGNEIKSLVFQSARVSANGRYMVFMSQEPLTGYDNRDAVSGPPDQEVFLFDDATGGLRCVSCNPSGARPHGLHDPGVNESLTYPVVDPQFLWLGQWLSGSVPAWEPIETSIGSYQPRFLSDSGRVFFDSADGLVPGDVNGVEDVYEWEPEGAAGGVCDSGVGGAGEVYVRGPESGTEVSGSPGVSAGCLGLISSGTSPEESVFLDANEQGSDVFFLTTGRLSAADVDSGYDIYDAHVCSSGSPCPAGAVSVAPACGSAEGCRGSGVSVEGAAGVPGTVNVSGAGNALGEQPRPAVAVRRAPTRAQLLASALRSCRRVRARARRAACERTARRRYAPVRKASKANRRNGR